MSFDTTTSTISSLNYVLLKSNYDLFKSWKDKFMDVLKMTLTKGTLSVASISMYFEYIDVGNVQIQKCIFKI